jgi:hypothetical protein
MIHATEIKEGTLTFRKLANDLRKELLKSTTLRASRTIAKGAFSSSFANSDDIKQSKEDEQEKRGRNKQKVTTKELLEKCSACEIPGYTLLDCLYVFPERANRTFCAHKARQEKVNKKLKEDKQLQKKVNRIKGKKPKKKETNLPRSNQD